MNKYQNGKIYKIVDVGYSKCYIGSTTESLSQRMTRHRAAYLKYLRDGRVKLKSTVIFDEYSPENCKIELIELYPCDSRMELLRKEGEHIKCNTCVNKIIAGRTIQEYRQDNAEIISIKAKAYREQNYEHLKQLRDEKREYLNESNREYYKANKEQINEKHRQHYANNKDDINTKHRSHYEQNKEKVLANQAKKITCNCGVTHRKGDKAKHERTKRHQQYMEQLQDQEQEK